MPRVEREIDIATPVESVFGFMANPINLQLYPGITRIREVSGEGLGSHWRETYQVGSASMQEDCEVIEYEPNHREVLENHGPLESTWTEEFEPVETGTHLRFIMDWKIPEDVSDEEFVYDMDNATRSSVDDYLRTVKDTLESMLAFHA